MWLSGFSHPLTFELGLLATLQMKTKHLAAALLPSDATNTNVRTSMGSSTYAPENDALVWKIKSFPFGKEYMLRAEFTLPSITAEEPAPERKDPIRVKFEIPYFTLSGIQVNLLRDCSCA
ncbi:hypothetical protein ACH5RR_037036 [Cinchona calisaya]|uniref:MHD domain-containing protein n=1 Tax=Cinchona calisaya TaxID=153742 RepID=A0ABD2Y4Y5_9GENT